MQIEIKSQGIAALVRELGSNADVTSTVIVGGVALFLSYGLWKIGRGIVQANRTIRFTLAKPEKRRTLTLDFNSAELAEIDSAPVLVRHWRKIDGIASDSIRRAGEARRSHEQAQDMLDALEFELAELLAEVAPLSAYAAERTAPIGRPVRMPARHPNVHRPIAA